MNKDVIAQATGYISVVEKGEKGATERPRKWEDIPNGDSLQCGAPGEQWLDIILYGGSWYQCIKSHTMGDGVVPTNTIYYKNITDYKRFATDLFLAHKAYIENLQVGDVLIEKDGQKLLVANEDGIECNNGKFNNVEVNGVVTSVGEDYTVKIDNGVIYFITKNNIYHLGLDSNGNPDWVNNETVFTNTYYTGNLISSISTTTLYTKDNKTYYTNPNCTVKASGTYYRPLFYMDALICSGEGIYCIYSTYFANINIYMKCTFSNGIKTEVGFIATGYNFRLDSTNNKFVKLSSKVYFKPAQTDKDGFISYGTIDQIITQDGTYRSISRNNMNISNVSGSYIYPLMSNGNTEAVFSTITITEMTSSSTYNVKNLTV